MNHKHGKMTIRILYKFWQLGCSTISVFSFSCLPTLKRLKMEGDIGGSELGRVLVNEFSYHMGRIVVIGVIDEKKAILRAESRREAS